MPYLSQTFFSTRQCAPSSLPRALAEVSLSYPVWPCHQQTRMTRWLSGWVKALSHELHDPSSVLRRIRPPLTSWLWLWRLHHAMCAPYPHTLRNIIHFLIKQEKWGTLISVQGERDHFLHGAWDIYSFLSGHAIPAMLLNHQPRGSEPKHWRNLYIWTFGDTDSNKNNLPHTYISSSLSLYTYYFPVEIAQTKCLHYSTQLVPKQDRAMRITHIYKRSLETSNGLRNRLSMPWRILTQNTSHKETNLRFPQTFYFY